MSNSERNTPPEEILHRYQRAIAGLLWMSESDYPLEVQLLPPAPGTTTVEDLLQQMPGVAEGPVTELTLQEWLGPATQQRDWHGQEERAIARRFRDLLDLIQTTLQEVHVFRVGTVNLHLYLLGRTADQQTADQQTADQQWLVLSTRAVET